MYTNNSIDNILISYVIFLFASVTVISVDSVLCVDTAYTAHQNINKESGSSSYTSLISLEKKISGSASVQAEIAALEEMLASLEHERAISGWQIIGQLRGGYINELQTESNERREYYPSQVTAGLTYPLFGKLTKEKINLLELEAGAGNERLKVERKKRDALKSLRTSYVLLWGAEKKIALAKAFLNRRSEYSAILTQRLKKGHLLKSDYLEFVTAWDLVAREILVNSATAERARNILESITNVRIPAPLDSDPDLPASCETIEEISSAITLNPEILLYQNLVELQLKKQQLAPGSDVTGNLTIRGLIGASEYAYSEFGYGGMVSMDVRMPFNPAAADSKNQLTEKRRLRRVQQELQLRTEELKVESLDRFRKLKAERANIRFALTRLQAAAELLRIKKLRTKKIDGDVIEQFQQARYNYYRVAVDLVDAEVNFLANLSKLLRVCSSAKKRVIPELAGISLIQPLSAPVDIEKVDITAYQPEEKPIEKETKKVVYFWRSAPVFDGTLSVDQFKDYSINKILISFNQEQLNKLSKPSGILKLERVISKFKNNGIETSLLLGEPTWILPNYRFRLMKILTAMNRFHFHSVHLDLEPSQLNIEKYGYEYLSSQLLRTVQLATEVSKAPLEISIHPRLLDKNVTGICFGCGLENLDLERVVVMIYRTDAQSVLSKMADLSREYPALNFGLAQSVETVLGPKNSYAHYEPIFFKKAQKMLMGEDNNNTWQGDVYIQDWTAYHNFLTSSRKR